MKIEEKLTLREFINELEKLSEGGKNDNLEVLVKSTDEELLSISWFGIDHYYPIEEIEDMNPQHPTKCVGIEI